jgi:transcriptional regulator with XRE-family HTH domain
MAKLGKRILELRRTKNFSQTELAKKVGISYAQIGRYETKGSQPPAEVLRKIANALDTTVDFLLNGTTDEKANATLKDAELIKQFKDVEQLQDADRSALIKVISGFVRDCKARLAYAI